MTLLPRYARKGVPRLSAALAWAPGLLQSVEGTTPLPAEPPIGGVVWTVVVPAALLVGSFLGTFLLYRRFSRGED